MTDWGRRGGQRCPQGERLTRQPPCLHSAMLFSSCCLVQDVVLQLHSTDRRNKVDSLLIETPGVAISDHQLWYVCASRQHGILGRKDEWNVYIPLWRIASIPYGISPIQPSPPFFFLFPVRRRRKEKKGVLFISLLIIIVNHCSQPTLCKGLWMSLLLGSAHQTNTFLCLFFLYSPFTSLFQCTVTKPSSPVRAETLL